MRNHQKEAAIIFIDFKKAFDFVDRNKPFQIFHAYGIPEKIVKAIQIMYVNISAVVLTPEEETTNFINTGVLQGDPLTLMSIIVLDYALRTAVDDREGLTLTRHRSIRHPPPISLTRIMQMTSLCSLTRYKKHFPLHKVESASKSTGLFLNTSKTKYMHINLCANDNVHSSDEGQIEKVEDFKYLRSYTNSQCNIQ